MTFIDNILQNKTARDKFGSAYLNASNSDAPSVRFLCTGMMLPRHQYLKFPQIPQNLFPGLEL